MSKFLIDKKYTNKDKFIIKGMSNGGLTVLVAMLKNPELYKAVIGISPFIDILKDYDRNYRIKKEYGDREHILEWSPLNSKLVNKKYPDLLLIVNLKDTTVYPYNGLSFTKNVEYRMNVYLLVNKDKMHNPAYLKSSSFIDSMNINTFIYDKLNLLE